MPGPPPEAPDLAAVIKAANGARLPFVIIGGFAVIANDYVRATEDVDLLISPDAEHDKALAGFLAAVGAQRGGQSVPPAALPAMESLRVRSDFGLIDLLRAGEPPLDFETVSSRAIQLEFHGEPARVASLKSLVAFKRLAGRPRDKLDLLELERIHGKLPVERVPGLDT